MDARRRMGRRADDAPCAGSFGQLAVTTSPLIAPELPGTTGWPAATSVIVMGASGVSVFSSCSSVDPAVPRVRVR